MYITRKLGNLLNKRHESPGKETMILSIFLKYTIIATV